MNTFYKQPVLLQWIEAILLLIIGFFPAMLIIEKGFIQPLYYLLFFMYVPVSQFACTPFFKLVGMYTYYSPMLLGYMANNKQIDLHSGGSFDYLFVMRRYNAGIELRNRLMLFHLEGLLNLIQLIENKKVAETVNIIGTSYFFSDRTLSKLGFKIETPTVFYRINLFMNFIDLFWMYSVSKGKLALPQLWKAKKAAISGQALVDNKKEIEALYGYMLKKFNA